MSKVNNWSTGFVAMGATAAPATLPVAETAFGRIAKAKVAMRIRAVNSIGTGPVNSVKTQTR